MSKALIIIVVSVTLGALLALAGSQQSLIWQGLPVFALCAGVAFLVQWLAFIPAYLRQTERFYDLTGSITYLSVVGFAVFSVGESRHARSLLLAAMVAVWAVRLGSFLFIRISQDGGDQRFDVIKTKPLRFLSVWTLQGLWVTVTVAAALAGIVSADQPELGLWALVGTLLWVVGFVVEVVADHQKRVFRATRDQTGHRFIRTGLWAYSRHPNYFGEIVLWLGVSVVAFPALSGWGYATLISPVFVILLLTRVSGLPTLEKQADKRFADDPLYSQYKAQTPVLVPRLTRPPALD